MKIWCISDTHNNHGLLNIPQDIDMVIHAGDFSCDKRLYINMDETMNFLYWYHHLNVKYKILIAGNHDVTLEHCYNKTKISAQFPSITYLENDGITIEGINIWGSPLTPTFGDGWAFNKSRDKIARYWEHIPDNTDILVTHGPPKGILDLNQDNISCGDGSLLKKILKLNIKYHIFGHIHNEKNSINSGVFTPSITPTTFVNASVTSLPGYKLFSNGIIINYTT
jgi:Icc-related predicted phosphoesterase